MNLRTWILCAAMLLPLAAMPQVQPPPNTVPLGESRLPTESAAGLAAAARPGGDDCNRQVQAIRDQFRIQEANVRREIAERMKLATGPDRERIRQEGDQRVASLRLEAAEAERRVMAACGG